MKISAISFLVIVTLLLLVVTAMVSMNVAVSWVFYTTCFGQFMIVLMVYKVLKDDYTTTRTFNDFYEDYPVGNL